MKILLVSIDRKAFDKDSAVARRFLDFSNSLESLEVLVITPNINDSEISLSDKVKVVPIFSPNKLFRLINLFFHLIKMGKNIKDKKNYLVSVQDPFFLGLVTLLATKILGVKMQAQVHIDFFSTYYKNESSRQMLESLIASFVLKNSAGIRVVSQKIKEYLVRDLRIPESKITSIPVSVNVEKVSNAPVLENLKNKYPQYKQVVLMVSRLVKQKNIPLAIKAFNQVIRKFPEAGLVIVGSGSEKSNIESYISKFGLSENIVIEDWSNDVYSKMKSADLFVMSSDYEGWGMTVIESVACGLPVIMTNVGCANEFIKNRENGLIIDIGDVNALKSSIIEVLENTELRKSLINNGFESLKNISKQEEFVNLIVSDWKMVLNN